MIRKIMVEEETLNFYKQIGLISIVALIIALVILFAILG